MAIKLASKAGSRCVEAAQILTEPFDVLHGWYEAPPGVQWWFHMKPRQVCSDDDNMPLLPQSLKATGRNGKSQTNLSKPATTAAQIHASSTSQQAADGKTVKPSRASSFLQWAKRQSQQRNKSLQEFILESAQAGSSGSAKQQQDPAPAAPCQRTSLETLGLQDVLAVLTTEQQQQQDERPKREQQLSSDMLLPVLEPFQPHNGYVRGPPKPHCHEARIKAADGIQALRTTRDGEIGEHCGTHALCIQSRFPGS